MEQTITVNASIPDTHVLVEKEEFQKLVELMLDPVWDMNDLKKKLKMSSEDTIKRKLLDNHKFKKTLKAQGIVHYPNQEFNRWRFNARKMNRFIDEHFEAIHGKGR
ncbi:MULTISPECIES: DUF771 domain-containing protein [Staphylococcus]|uniref:DUF771 domain-containing protein n=1 Tax=Staphylococcus TaxID=1279 RepID=UPI000853C30C|nr:DUF771 domain-containing protein [Staphylococcus equorum]MDK9845194.1 DUF771 domain-containing protein [Staphylococcus equorum]MDK9849119.1 DUF771 domain-containing protein [Staphylococcus equorum]MDK9854426.1 DUF771 domain-containing protein [Staphylococcus equorum]OEK55389.1 hypothetical protein ASS95_01125 [Staphylococcus equorum]